MTVSFTDRAAAGRALAERLQGLCRPRRCRRDGAAARRCPGRAEVAKALDAPLDLLIVRKLAVPRRPELAMGAIAGGGAMYVDPQVVADYGVGRDELEEIVAAESLELIRRHAHLLGGPPTAVAVEGAP